LEDGRMGGWEDEREGWIDGDEEMGGLKAD